MILNKGAFTNCDSSSLIYLISFCNIFISVKVFLKEQKNRATRSGYILLILNTTVRNILMF